MYAITVTFDIKPGFENRFREAMLMQARNSLELEEGCYIFEVCSLPDRPETFFLYELYKDEGAFRDHCDSGHFKSFDQQTAPWVSLKTVQEWKHLMPETTHA